MTEQTSNTAAVGFWHKVNSLVPIIALVFTIASCYPDRKENGGGGGVTLLVCNKNN